MITAAEAWNLITKSLTTRKARRRAASAAAARLREERTQAAITPLGLDPDRVDRLVTDVLADTADHRWLRGEGVPPWERS